MNLVIAPAPWSRELGELLDAAMRRDPCCTVGTLRGLVESGKATLLRISSADGSTFGAIVLEIHRHDRGADGVIVAAAMARRFAWRYVPALLADIERRFYGLSRIRVQTPSRGLVKMLARRGYLAREVVLYKDLGPELQAQASSRRLSSRECALLELPELDARGFAPMPCPALQASPGRLYIKGHQTDKSTTKQEDRRLALNEGAIGISGDENVLNVLDAGAIEGAFDFAKSSDQETHRTLAGVLDFADVVFKTGAKQVEQAYSEARGEATQKNLVAAAAIGSVAIVAIRLWGRK